MLACVARHQQSTSTFLEHNPRSWKSSFFVQMKYSQIFINGWIWNGIFCSRHISESSIFCQYPSSTSVLIIIRKVVIYKASVFNFAKTAQFADRLFNAPSMSRLTKHVMNSNLSNLVIAPAYPRARGMRLNIFKYCLASFLFQHTFSN